MRESRFYFRGTTLIAALLHLLWIVTNPEP
jgi:hypothetical protein